MAWKILTILGILSLSGASWLSWQNKIQLADARHIVAKDIENKAEAIARKQELTDLKTNASKSHEALTGRLDTKTTEIQTLETDKKEAEQAVTSTKNLLDEVSKTLTALEEKVKINGDIEKLLATVSQHQTDLETATNESTKLKSTLAAVESRNTNLENQLKLSYEAEQKAKRGVVAGDFQANVSRSYPQFGFVVVNKGGDTGAFLNSVLDIRRGNLVVGRVKITHVESNSSAANVVPGSMAPGDAPQQGDLLVAGEDARRIASTVATNATPSEDAPATPAVDAALPAPGGNQAPADPFNTPTGDSTPATVADPFNTPSTSSDAPTGTADPFNTPSTSSDAPTGTADPFNTPKKNTTPANPNTSTPDPFDTPPANDSEKMETAPNP